MEGEGEGAARASDLFERSEKERRRRQPNASSTKKGRVEVTTGLFENEGVEGELLAGRRSPGVGLGVGRRGQVQGGRMESLWAVQCRERVMR